MAERTAVRVTNDGCGPASYIRRRYPSLKTLASFPSLSGLVYPFLQASPPHPCRPCPLRVRQGSGLQTLGSPGARSCHRRARKGRRAPRRRPRAACRGLERGWLPAALPRHREREAGVSGVAARAPVSGPKLPPAWSTPAKRRPAPASASQTSARTPRLPQEPGVRGHEITHRTRQVFRSRAGKGIPIIWTSDHSQKPERRLETSGQPRIACVFGGAGAAGRRPARGLRGRVPGSGPPDGDGQ